MTTRPRLSAFPITPTEVSGRVDVAALRRLVGPLCAAGVDSIGVLGSTGSYPYLTRGERRRALDAALDESNGRVPVLAGIGALRTDEAIGLAEDAKAAGAEIGLLAPVSYTPLTDDEVFQHFASVAGESGLPLCIYDNPGTTHFRFGPALLRRLGRVPGIVAIKSPAVEAHGIAAHVSDLRSLLPAEVSLGFSVDWHAIEAMLAGGNAWYSVIAGLFPASAVAIVRAIGRGDAVEARRLNARLEPLWALFRTWSSLRVIYACADLLGLSHAAPPRPILPVPEATRHEIAETLRALDLS